MKKPWSKFLSRRDSTRPLINDNNNYIENGHESECMLHNSLRKNEEKKSQELFSPCSDDASDDDNPSNSFEPMQSRKGSMSLTFPEIPADLDQNLHRHLENVEEIVQNKRNSRSGDNSGCLEDHFLLQTSEHLNILLQNISTSKNCLHLINWVFERKQLFHNSESDLVEEWGAEAETKLLERIKEEVRVSLDKILQEDRNQTEHNEETYIQLYVDIIQCINAMPTYAQKVRPRLYPQVQEVCYQELCNFVKSREEEWGVYRLSTREGVQLTILTLSLVVRKSLIQDQHP
ncbi:PREDICTED: uncharacterized protein LOC107087101 [Cyprinodon variegatus]|uniref:uncharacterized protein LOC107087101 n=1 Tax=Cyprinodon variegatus TaxID=28743 RepID=UPI000742AA8D|nr:PREDICTED: uncharacterized protein LOC107087101 [Cyprinodon variegatus]